jgi:PilZ domain
VLPARVLNLSLNGAFVALSDAPAPPDLKRGTEVTLAVLDRGAPECLYIRATVVRSSDASEPAGVGLRFQGLDNAALKRLEGILLTSIIEGEGFLDV